MALQTKIPDKGDPSDILQVFSEFNIKLLCCRYWWLKHWEFNELSFPYWRIYHNNKRGATISYKEKQYHLNENTIVMIAPNTSFSTHLYNYLIPKEGYVLEGGRVGKERKASQLLKEEILLHLFVHFNLGSPYDNVDPGIFLFNVSKHFLQKLSVITSYLNSNHMKFNFQVVITIQSLIADLLTEIPENKWDLISKDNRILDSLNYIENNPKEDLSNTALATRVQLATNAFNRLFTTEVSISPQRFVKKKRIDKACILLHHSQYSIDKIAEQCGFADRYHFSRIFKQITNISPARYRRDFRLG